MAGELWRKWTSLVWIIFEDTDSGALEWRILAIFRSSFFFARISKRYKTFMFSVYHGMPSVDMK